jgi:uncharacterized protein (DUF4415 family)
LFTQQDISNYESFHREKQMTENNKNTSIQTLNGSSSNVIALVSQEKSIDYSDSPELTDAWFLQAKRASQLPEKKQVSLRIDEDILEFFKQQGSRYQTRMHAVLRAYVDGCRKTNE